MFLLLLSQERDVRAASWNPYVGPVLPAVSPLGGVKSDWEILGLLAKRLGIDDLYMGKPVEVLLEAVLEPMRQYGLSPASAMTQVFRKPNAPGGIRRWCVQHAIEQAGVSRTLVPGSEHPTCSPRRAPGWPRGDISGPPDFGHKFPLVHVSGCKLLVAVLTLEEILINGSGV